MEIKKVSTLEYKGKKFVVVFSTQFNRYMTIAAEDISNGKLLKEYNGLVGRAEETEQEAIRSRKQAIDINELLAAGCTIQEAVEKVIGGL